MRAKLRWLATAAVAVGALAVLIAAVGARDVFGHLAAANPRWFALAVGLTVLQLPVVALRWWTAMRLLGQGGGLLPLVQDSCDSNFVNFFAPGHFGEAFAAAWLDRSQRAVGVEAFSVLVGCKAVGIVLHVSLAMVGLPLLAGQVPGLGRQIGLVLVATGSAAAIVAGGLAWPTSFGLLVRLGAGSVRGVCAPLGAERGDRAAAWFRSAAGRFRGVLLGFASHPAALASTVAWSSAKTALLVGALLAAFRAVGVPMSFLGAVFLQAIDALGNIAAIWVPGNLGIQEAILTTGAAGLGVQPSQALSVALLSKASGTIFVLVSGAVWVLPDWFVQPERE